MEISLSLASYILSLELKKEGKKVITYLPESSILKTLKNKDKGDFLASEEERAKLKKYQESLNGDAFWKTDEGYAFIEKHLPKGSFSLLDVGCHVGQLPAYLKQKNRWSQLDYTGTDIVGSLVDLAKKEFKEGYFFVSDIQEFITEKSFDIVLTKGTIISTFDPIKSTKNVLSIPAKKTFVLHTPISDEELEEEYYNILVHSKDYVYTSSVLSRKGFDRIVEEKEFNVIASTRRTQKFNVLNKGNYHLYDFLLEKKS